MTQSNAALRSEQATLEEFTDPDRCTEIAVDTGERCQHPAVPGLDVCHGHIDDEDLAQLAATLTSGEMAK